MANISTGSAKYEGFGKDGKGHVSTGSGALDNQPYGFKTRFEDEPGTNPVFLEGFKPTEALRACTKTTQGAC